VYMFDTESEDEQEPDVPLIKQPPPKLSAKPPAAKPQAKPVVVEEPPDEIELSMKNIGESVVVSTGESITCRIQGTSFYRVHLNQCDLQCKKVFL